MKTIPEPKLNLKTDFLSDLRGLREASYAMAVMSTKDKNEALTLFAKKIKMETSTLLEANAKDLREQSGKLEPELMDRLELTPSKLQSVCEGVRDLIRIEDPIGKVLFKRELDEKLVLQKVTVPLGVVAVIFESRPDVIPQILALMLKSGNACALKGGSEATHSNAAFLKIMNSVQLESQLLPQGWVKYFETRESVNEILKAEGYVDLIVPRGSGKLVRWIKSQTSIPVLGHAEGICHLYVHQKADIKIAVEIAVDSKAQYPAACNSIESLLVDSAIAEKFLHAFDLAAKKLSIKLLGCDETQKILKDILPTKESDWCTEYGDLRLSIKVVNDLSEAIQHINRYGSHHTDAIVTKSEFDAEIFLRGVDSASVFWNASTRFADGFRFGFGAEVGVSTERIHARGPVGIEGLVSYTYRLRGSGQVVSDYIGSPPRRRFTHRDL